YVDGISGAPTNTATPTEPTNVYRDSNGGGTGSQGLPIRRQRGPITALPAVAAAGNTAPDGVRSYAGWTDPKADLGGYVFQSWTPLTNVGYYYPQTVLASVRATYGYSLGAAGLVYVPGGSLPNEQYSAWLGNRDGAPTFGNEVGTPGYYDTTVTTCNPASGPSIANKCIQYASGASTYAINQSCTPAGSVNKEIDANGQTRFTQGGACNPTGGAQCQVNGVNQPMATCTGAPANLVAPTCSTLTDTNFFTAVVAANCSYSGFTTVNVGTCVWNAARQTVLIEGSSYPAQGTHYYGGACVENGSTASCSSGGASKVLNGVLQANVMGGYASPPPAGGPGTSLGCSNIIPPGNYNYGGTCGGGAVYQMPTFNNSQIPGAFPVPPVPSATSAGPPAARQLIGSAPNPLGSRVAICAAASGGVTYTIRANPSRTYNPACNNNYSNKNSCAAWYGTSCVPNSTPSANCPNRTNSVAAGATGQWYQAYQLQATGPTGFVHECLADNGTGNNPGNGVPTSFMRTFTQAYSGAATPNASVVASSGLTAAYTTNAAQGIYNAGNGA
ncbi:MAG: hypothetical protein NTZ05_01740, partial [Chloroflexi bacterium]|nr:hypothetical protein [Chloroflexota bacterium]